jgi:hypothetical protein
MLLDSIAGKLANVEKFLLIWIENSTIALMPCAKGPTDMLKAPDSLRTPEVVKPVFSFVFTKTIFFA